MQYTYVCPLKDKIHHYYIDENGSRKRETITFEPTLAIPSKKPTGWTDIYGRPVEIKHFDNIYSMYSFRKENEEHTSIYGDIGVQYQFISEKYPDKIIPKFNAIKIYNMDIEVFSETGFPEPNKADYPVTAITIQDVTKNRFYVFAYKEDYTPKQKNITYFFCRSEADMLDQFLTFWKRDRPDVITGWNTKFFDVPYLINRIPRILDTNRELDLSPFGVISKEKSFKTEEESYSILGISHLDYFQLYKKFNQTTRESYSLNHISQMELDQEKITYHHEYNSLADLYNRNFELYIDYNIKDVDLVYQIDEKKKFLHLAFTLAYTAKCNFEDVFGSVKIWDVFVFNELAKRHMVVAPKKNSNVKTEFVGGYVKEPKPGYFEWIGVADITSSYPNQIISFNLSPETLVPENRLPEELLQLKRNTKQIDGFVNLEEIKKMKPILEKYNVSFAANCEFFSKEKFGVFPEIISEVFAERKKKKKMAEALYTEIKELGKELEELESGH